MREQKKISGKILFDHINLLGYSGAMLSILFERLKVHNFTGGISIITNMGITDEVPFENGLSYSIVPVETISKLTLKSCLFSSSSPRVKIAVFEDFRRKLGIGQDHYFSLIDPVANIASTVTYKSGVSIEPGVTVSPYANLGFGVTIARNSSVGHHTLLDDFVTLNQGVNVAGHCSVGEGTVIGIGTSVFDHITIGKNCQIGGGSVVTRDIPDGVIAYGNPCRVIREANR